MDYSLLVLAYFNIIKIIISLIKSPHYTDLDIRLRHSLLFHYCANSCSIVPFNTKGEVA